MKKQEKDYNKPLKKLTLADRINEAKRLVLEKLAELKSLNEKLREDFVPAVVIANLTKTIKDVDVCFTLLFFVQLYHRFLNTTHSSNFRCCDSVNGAYFENLTIKMNLFKQCDFQIIRLFKSVVKKTGGLS
jgi:hypothetical protein